MRILALETATWLASVAVSDGEDIVAEWECFTRGQHAAVLLPAIRDTLRNAGITLADIDVVAVSIGPGSFTGLRVGMSVAKGLAYARNIPLVGIPTLEALACAALPAVNPIVAVLDARKGELYAAGYRPTRSGVEPLFPEQLLPFDELADKLPRPCVVIGDATETDRGRLRQQLGSDVELLPFPERAARARIVARLAARKLQQEGIPIVTPEEPHYLRPAEAQVKRSPAA